jgi:hypothetical protein
VTEPRALREQALFVSRFDALRTRDELGELVQPFGPAGGGSGQLVAAAAGGLKLSPGLPQIASAAKLLLPDERVEHVELVRGCPEATLLELSRHREQPLDKRREILARDGAAPGVRTRATVGEHATGGHEAFLPRGTQLGDRLQGRVVEDLLRQVELGLHIGLLGTGPQVRGVAGCTQEEAHRLRQDRLARAGLSGDGVQPGGEGEIGLADEDEVLDAEAAQQG